jgi:hypothetical protein
MLGFCGLFGMVAVGAIGVPVAELTVASLGAPPHNAVKPATMSERRIFVFIIFKSTAQMSN